MSGTCVRAFKYIWSIRFIFLELEWTPMSVFHEVLGRICDFHGTWSLASKCNFTSSSFSEFLIAVSDILLFRKVQFPCHLKNAVFQSLDGCCGNFQLFFKSIRLCGSSLQRFKHFTLSRAVSLLRCCILYTPLWSLVADAISFSLGNLAADNWKLLVSCAVRHFQCG